MERNVIKSVNHKGLLSECDKNLKDGGSETHTWHGSIENVVQNYDNVYYHNLTDKVFLLDVKELYDYVYERGYNIKAYPTLEAVDNSTYKYGNLSSGEYCDYWLRSPNAVYSNCVRYVGGVGSDGVGDNIS